MQSTPDGTHLVRPRVEERGDGDSAIDGLTRVIDLTGPRPRPGDDARHRR